MAYSEWVSAAEDVIQFYIYHVTNISPDQKSRHSCLLDWPSPDKGIGYGKKGGMPLLECNEVKLQYRHVIHSIKTRPVPPLACGRLDTEAIDKKIINPDRQKCLSYRIGYIWWDGHSCPTLNYNQRVTFSPNFHS